jgi:hypothetical protein
VVELRLTGVRHIGLGQHEWRAAHALDPTGDQHVGIAGPHRPGRLHDGFAAGGAQSVDRHTGDRGR